MKKLWMFILIALFAISCASIQQYHIALKLKDGSTIYHKRGKISVNRLNVWIRTKNGLSKYKVENIDALILLDKTKELVIEEEKEVRKIENKKNPCNEIMERYMRKFETK